MAVDSEPLSQIEAPAPVTCPPGVFPTRVTRSRVTLAVLPVAVAVASTPAAVLPAMMLRVMATLTVPEAPTLTVSPVLPLSSFT